MGWVEDDASPIPVIIRLYLIKLFNFSYPEGNFGGNQLLEDRGAGGLAKDCPRAPRSGEEGGLLGMRGFGAPEGWRIGAAQERA